MDHFEKGNHLYAEGEYEEAITQYTEAIRLNPKHVNAIHNKGGALEALERYEEAISQYNELIRLDPKDVFAYNSKGLALRAMGRDEEAIKQYDEVIRLDSQSVFAYINKGNALKAMGKNQEAITQYNKAIHLDPNDAEVYYNKANALLAMGRNEEAISQYDHVIRLDSKHVDAFLNKGFALQDIGRDEEAIDQYNEVIRLDPTNVSAYHNKGFTLNEMGRFEEALECYDNAINLATSKKPLHYCNRGRLYNELGQTEKALADFKIANSLVQQGIWGKNISDANKKFIKESLSKILELEQVVEETRARLNKLDQKNSAVKAAVEQFKKLQAQRSMLISQQVSRIDGKIYISQTEVEKQGQRMRELEKQFKELIEEVNLLTERVAVVEKTVQELKYDIEKMREDFKTNGVLDKVRIQEGFRDLKISAPELYAYAKAFYWTLLNYLMAYRNSRTGLVQTNAGSASNQEYQSWTKVYLIDFGIRVTKPIPIIGNVIQSLNDALNYVNRAQAKRRFENQVSIINQIVMEHNAEDDLNTTVAFTALDVAFKLKAGNTFEFDEARSDSVWKKIDNQINEPIDKIKSLFLQESIDLYDGPAAGAALRDVMLLLAYLYERHEFVISQKRNLDKPFHELFADIIILKKYMEVLGNSGSQAKSRAAVTLEKIGCTGGGCGSDCNIF